MIFIDQADDTLLTEQRNLLDLINKLEGGLGQVETQIVLFLILCRVILWIVRVRELLEGPRKMRVQQEFYR